MSRFYQKLEGYSTVNLKTGSNMLVSPEFYIASSMLLSQSSFVQNLLLQLIYASLGNDLEDVKRVLKSFPNPKARIDFLCSFPYKNQDDIISRVFNFSREIFKEIYELRNILSHEVWSSSDDHIGMVLFYDLDENAKLLMVSGRLWHRIETTPEEVYNATIKFVRNIKRISLNHLRSALNDLNTCSWALMNIENVIKEEDPAKRNQARKAFLVFKGTSHIFDESLRVSEIVEFSSSRSREI